MTKAQLDNIKMLAARLQRLLEGPEPGLSTWHRALHDTLNAFAYYSNEELRAALLACVAAMSETDDYAAQTAACIQARTVLAKYPTG